MSKFSLSLSLLLSTLAFSTACVEADLGTASGRVVIDQPCAADTDCPTGFECEIEVEHGVTTSFCKSDDDHSDGTCPAGYELEIEHGVSYCQPHGGDGSGGGSGSDDGSGGGSGSDDGSGGGSGGGSGSD
ncbi:MAG: hypothetical protein ABL886_17685, partial [Rhodoglobus sp.]